MMKLVNSIMNIHPSKANLTTPAKMVLMAIACHVDDEYTSTVSIGLIETYTGLSRATVKRCVKALTNDGFIFTKSGGGMAIPNTYTINLSKIKALKRYCDENK